MRSEVQVQDTTEMDVRITVRYNSPPEWRTHSLKSPKTNWGWRRSWWTWLTPLLMNLCEREVWEESIIIFWEGRNHREHTCLLWIDKVRAKDKPIYECWCDERLKTNDLFFLCVFNWNWIKKRQDPRAKHVTLKLLWWRVRQVDKPLKKEPFMHRLDRTPGRKNKGRSCLLYE